MPILSLVVPCYNEEEAAPLFYQAVQPVAAQLEPLQLEILFVDDGSKDGTLEVLKRLHAQDKRAFR